MGIGLREEDDEFVVTADVPGFQKDDIDLQIRDNTLSIDATHEQQAEEEDETYLRSERKHRSLREHVRLPEPVREGDVTAAFQNGVLTVHIPKIESNETSGHQIEIE